MWKKYKKVTGKDTKPPKHALNVNGQMLHDTKDICNAIASKLEDTSSDQYYSAQFLRHKNTKESRIIQFNIDEQNPEYYNESLTSEELQQALNQAKNTAPGSDQINAEMLQNLPNNAKQYLLSMYNQVWNNNVFPNKWRESLIIPIPKPGKDPIEQRRELPPDRTHIVRMQSDGANRQH